MTDIQLDLIDKYNLNDDVLFMEGFDDCILGVCDMFGRPTVVAYDLDEVMVGLIDQGMSPEEAEEWFEFNQRGAWCGDYTPVFVHVERR